MEALLKACADIFDQSPQAFGIARVFLDDAGNPVDFTYEYLNPAMADMTGQKVEDLQGKAVFRLWPGGDVIWLDKFYEAAYKGRSVEFETVSDLIEQFLHVMAFPIVPEYCGFMIQNAVSFVNQAHMTMENASAALFFYDRRTHLIMLTLAAREICSLDTSFMGIESFTERLFSPELALEIQQKIISFSDNEEQLLFEGQIKDGRWLRFALSNNGKTNRFAYGLLEDITRTKQAELHSVRRMEVIESLSRENFALYLVDLDSNHIEPYRVRDKLYGALAGAGAEGMDYSEFVDAYSKMYVAQSDQEMVKKEISTSSILRHFEEEDKDFSVSYRRLFDDSEQFVELRVFRLSGQSHKAVLAARNINDEINEQLRQKEALKVALNLAENASNAKSTFLTNMSHDFRTPMNSITGFANIALDHLDDTDRVRDCLHKIMLSSDHLIELVNDILDVSRIESGKMSLNEDTVNLVELGESIETMFSGQAAERGLTFVVDTSGVRHSQVQADQLRLNQILVNTIGNALKFTPRGGTVNFTLREDENAPSNYSNYVFDVKDTGCGMNQDFLERVFLPFERDTLDSVNHSEGTGLGMTITKNLVDLMGGSIEVTSEVGKGSEFIITIPLLLATKVTDKAATSSSGAANPVTYRDFSGFRALVVDDDDLSREIAVEVLSEHGILSDEADDGDTAIEMFSQSAPFYYDVIIMDMRMPRLSGDEATRIIREMDREDVLSLPIVATTADAFEEGYRRSREAGMTAHLTKPLNIQLLLDLLDSILPDKPASERSA